MITDSSFLFHGEINQGKEKVIPMKKICKQCGNEFDTNRSKRKYCGRTCSNSIIASRRESKKLDVPLKTIWSCGGGVQSTAIAILIINDKLPKPDYAVMTDCGWEKQSTWDYVDGVIKPKLKEIGLSLQIVSTTDYSDNDLYDNNGHLLIPAYKKEGEKVIKFKTHCSNKWKVKPVKRWLRTQGIQRCENWIGISIDEAKRIKQSIHKWFQLRYPLIELGIDREECLWIIGKAGWPMSPRTSCLMCPQQDNRAWLSMQKNYPEDWAKAVEVDKQIREHDHNIYLHRSLMPLTELIN